MEWSKKLPEEHQDDLAKAGKTISDYVNGADVAEDDLKHLQGLAYNICTQVADHVQVEEERPWQEEAHDFIHSIAPEGATCEDINHIQKEDLPHVAEAIENGMNEQGITPEDVWNWGAKLPEEQHEDLEKGFNTMKDYHEGKDVSDDDLLHLRDLAYDLCS